MTLDRFISAFEKHFPAQPFKVRYADATVVIPCGNPEIGAIKIQDDLNELIVFVGIITHRHFGGYTQSFSAEERTEDAAAQVIEFLSDVFAGKVEFYRYGNDGGGWRPASSGLGHAFTWSSASKI